MEIRIDTGVQEYDINGYKVRFNPTDPVFLRKIYAAFEQMDRDEMDWREQLSGASARETIDLYDKGAAMFSSALDSFLGDGATAHILGGVSPLAYADGLPLWAVLTLAVMDKMDEGIQATVSSETSGKLDKYIKKYRHK